MVVGVGKRDKAKADKLDFWWPQPAAINIDREVSRLVFFVFTKQ